MKNDLTFTIIKPSAVKDGNFGRILQMITDEGFNVRALKLTKLTQNQAENFYFIHKGKPFFEELVTYMTSGLVIVAVLSREDAVSSFRNFIGVTNPNKAEKGTIRELFGKSITQNAIHGSDSNENASIEMEFFFKRNEIYL
ncbi:MAG: nucleoside-diphosphate kinase [Hyphomicrobiales bacterium]